MHTVMQSERIRLVKKDRIDLKIRVSKEEISSAYMNHLHDTQEKSE
jgi:hypothetical protein